MQLDFSGPPKEFLFFNSYHIERDGEFLSVILGFTEQTSASIQVFRGVVWKFDVVQQFANLKNYLERIGGPRESTDNPRRPFVHLASPPTTFNQIGCASRGNWGEISINQFSHKEVIDKSKPSSDSCTVLGVTHGVYVSDCETHKRFIYDLITSAESP